MSSKRGLREIKISPSMEMVKDTIISSLEPIWRTTGLLKSGEEVVDIQFNVEGLTNITVIPITLKIRKGSEVYFEEVNA